MNADRAGHQGFKTDGFLFHPHCVCEGGFFVQGFNPIRSAEYHPGEGYRGGQLQTLSDLHQERAASNGSGSPTFFDWPVAASASEGMAQNNSNNLGSWPAMEAGLSSGSRAETCSNVLLSNLSVLQQKAQQLEAFVQEGRHDQQGSVSGFISSILYELIATAASLLLSVQNRESTNLAPADVPTRSDPGGSVVIQADNRVPPPLGLEFRKRANPNGASVVGFGGGSDLQHNKSPSDIRAQGEEEEATTGNRSPKIIEINETDILTEHAHFCEMCGKGFRREANVRMHMRAHGDEYKTNQALMSKPLAAASSRSRAASKYSCPSERCRRNKNHRDFKPLKSITSLRNHYKRSHCPKMYTCQKCDKQFSIVGDLKTHGKQCGHSLWRCSCGTTFTRKDKLLSHVTLFEGHKPLLDHEFVLPPAPKRDKAASNGRATTAWSSGYVNNANHTEFAAADLAGLANDKIQGYEDVIQMGHGQNEVTLESRLTDSVFWVNS